MASGEKIQDAIGDRGLASGGLNHYISGPVDDDDRVAVGGETLAPADPVEYEKVAALPRDLRAPELEQPRRIRLGFRAETDDDLARPGGSPSRAAASAARMSGFRTSSRLSRSPFTSLRIFPSAMAVGR